jgi:hypothetical protein
LIKEYMEIGVKNDEQLIKMATIVQRALQVQAQNNSNELSFSEEEKAQLFDLAKNIGENK